MDPRFFLLLSTICILLQASPASAVNPTTRSSNHVRGTQRHVHDTSRRLDQKDDATTSSLPGDAAAAVAGDDIPAFLGASRKESSKKSTSKQSRALSSNSQQYSNIFQQATRSNETSPTTTGNSTIPTSYVEDGIGYYPPDKVPLRPVQCGGAQTIHSALLVRMVGEPSLVTRYEKMRLEQVVLESYNDWMESACDGYHRQIDAVELRPIDNVNLVTQAHQETWVRDQDHDDSDENYDETIPTNRQLVQPHDDSKQAPLSSAQPSLAPTYVYYDDPNVLYRPLYWLSVTATCRNCPRNSLGNSNLLASHASFSSMRNETRDTAAHQPVFSADSLILEEVCFCPAKTNRNNNEANRGVSNGTNIIFEQPEEEPMTIDDLFPDAEAPTSVDLLVSINMRIQQLRTTGALINIESLMQLTEPDYAYYAEEMAQTVVDDGPVISAEDESEEVVDSSLGQSSRGNETESDEDQDDGGGASVNDDKANISTTPPVDKSPPEEITQASASQESKATPKRLLVWVAPVSALVFGFSFWTVW